MLFLQVGQWLQANDLVKFVEVFSEMEVSGELLEELKDSELKEFVRQGYASSDTCAQPVAGLGDEEAARGATPQGVGKPMIEKR